MLQEVEQKLNNLASKCDVDVILIKHEENGTTYVGLHQVFGHNDEDHLGVSWSEEPIVHAYDLPALLTELSKMTLAASEGHIVTENELQQFNWNIQKKRVNT
jgi:hypothetical protein